NTLWRTIPGIQNISAGIQNQMPTTRLVSGDTDQNNEINIIDYNAFISCLQLDECGQDEDEQNISRLVDRVISFFKNLIPKKVFAQSASQNTCNMLRQQLTYLQTNNLCISNICTS